MANFNLNFEERKNLENGWYDVVVKDVNYNSVSQRMEIVYQELQTKTFIKECFFFLKQDGTKNDIAFNIFSYAVKVILKNFELKTLEDEQLLIGHKVRINVEQRTYTTADGIERITYNIKGREQLEDDDTTAEDVELPF